MSTFRLMLAPMEDITDDAFRTLCHSHGADLTFTPMARVSGLIRGNKPTLFRIEISSETPTEIQLLCNKVDRLERFLATFEPPTSGFQGFNLNLGCPSPNVIRDGLGCAMIRRVSRTAELVRTIHDHGYSASIKLRLGKNAFEKEKRAYLNVIEAVDADFFIVHARHGLEDLEDPADNYVYDECVGTGRKIIANGDVRSKDQITELRNLGVSGVMIGRAAVKDPSIFTRLRV